MLFLEKLKDKFLKLIEKVSSSITKLNSKFFPKKEVILSSDIIKIYHHEEFSFIFIDTNKINLLSEDEFQKVLDYIIKSIRNHLKENPSILINIITKAILEDTLNITYTHSATYKMLFSLKELENWKSFITKDINELLNNYNDSCIKKIEFRFDYITSETLKKV